MTDLIQKDSIEALLAHRDRALLMYRQCAESAVAAIEAHRRACVGLSHINGLHWEALRFIHYGANQPRELASFMEKQRATLDSDMWRALLVNTKLGTMMDAQERKEFEKSLENPAEVNMDTVMATLGRLAMDARRIFRRGLVEAFRGLSRDHASNSGWRIGPRMVAKRIVTVVRHAGASHLWVRFDHHGEQYLRDIDRACHVLSGRQPPEPLQGIVGAMQTAIHEGRWEASTDLMRVVWHKNGNGHLYILPPKLRDDMNMEVAAHFGAALAQPRGRAA